MVYYIVIYNLFNFGTEKLRQIDEFFLFIPAIL